MTQEEKARAYDEALNKAKIEINTKGIGEAVNLCYQLFPQLAKSDDEESDDERIRKRLIEYFEGFRMGNAEVRWEGLIVQEVLAWLEKQKEQKPVTIEQVYKEFITPEKLKDAKTNKYIRAQLLWELMHNGIITEVDYQYLTDDNRKPWTEEEYRIAYQKGFDTSEQLKQKEQKHNYCLYGGYPNVGRCRWCSAACSARLADVHTDEEKEYIRTIKSIISDFIRDKKPENLAYYQRIYDWLDGRHVPFSCGHENGEPTEWDNLQEEFRNINEAFEDGKKEVIDHPDKYGLTKQKTPDPVFSKQEYESYPIISEDTTSAKPVERSLEDDHIIGFVYDLLNEIEWKDDWAMSKEECLRLLSNYNPQKFTGVTINGESIPTETKSVDIPLAEWSEEDEEMRDTCIDLLKHFPRPCGEVIGPWKDCTAWLKSLPEKFVLQPKQEWDVEDKLMIKCCLEAINVYKHKAKRGKFLPARFNIGGYLASPEKVESWLKFLPGRFNLQPKQEWSDEDEHRRDGIIQWLREYQEKFNPKYDSLSIESIESLIDWLKSIRPSWKPSEKQMDRLFSIVAVLRKDCCDDMADFLASSYHNLKKLM
jgi:hypothetical protein